MITAFLAAHAGAWFLPVVIGAALADSLNPCAYSILFLSTAFLFSLGKDRRFIASAGGLYIFGIALVYTLIGVGILKTLSFFAVPDLIGKVGALIIIVYSLIGIANVLVPSFPIKLKIPASGHETLARIVHRASLPASFLLGVAVGLFEFPCTGGPYLFVLSLIHAQTTFWSGFGYLLVYNFFFVLPLIVVLAIVTTRLVLERVDAWRRAESKKARLALNFLLLAIGLVIFAF